MVESNPYDDDPDTDLYSATLDSDDEVALRPMVTQEDDQCGGEEDIPLRSVNFDAGSKSATKPPPKGADPAQLAGSSWTGKHTLTNAGKPTLERQTGTATLYNRHSEWTGMHTPTNAGMTTLERPKGTATLHNRHAETHKGKPTLKMHQGTPPLERQQGKPTLERHQGKHTLKMHDPVVISPGSEQLGGHGTLCSWIAQLVAKTTERPEMEA